jgi:hypothetical protein
MKEIMETIAAIVLLTFLALAVWLVVGMVVHSWLEKYPWYNKIKYTYKFKIPEKYETKVNPIYELTDDEWNNTSFFIKKWSLRFYQKEAHQILAIFLIYPIEFLSFGYQHDDSVFLCKKKDIESIEGTLEENYEKIWAKENEQYLTEKALKDQQKQRIKDLNQVFDENYE